MAYSLLQYLEDLAEQFFSGTAIGYGGTGQSGTISGNPTGGTGNGSSYGGSAQDPAIDPDLYIDMEVIGDLSLLTPIRLVELEWGNVTTIYYANGNTLELELGAATVTPIQNANQAAMAYVRTVEMVMCLRSAIAAGICDDPHLPTVMAEEFEYFLDNHPKVIVGTAGNDLVSGYGLLAGGLGDDTLVGSEGRDYLYAGEGNNIAEGGRGGDVLIGNGGWTVATYWHARTAVVVHLDNTGNTGDEAFGDSYINVNGAIGSAYDDVIAGNGNDNWLIGGLGNDLLSGGLGNDSLFGAEGDDTLVGGAGNDVLKAGAGNNILEGGAGADTLDGSGGWGVADYRHARTAVTVRLDNTGNAGDEALGDVFIDVNGAWGSAFGDVLVGNAGANWMIGDGGNDRLEGRRGSDTLYGSDGADTLDGGDDNDTLIGDNGNDVLSGGAGADILDGGAGFDLASFADSNVAVIASLATGNGGGDTFSSIEGLAGSALDDQLIGNTAANLLQGNGGSDYLRGDSGADTLEGGSGDDRLVGDSGADLLNGGDGFDTAIYTSSLAGLAVDLGRPSAGTGEAAGDSFLSIEAVSGSSYNDGLTGDDLGNLLSGNGGSDLLSGNAGSDTIDGGTGNDTLQGGAGADYLTGGIGRDVFAFDAAPGVGTFDRIIDFTVADDQIQLSRGAFPALAAGALASSAFKLGIAATQSTQRILYDAATGDLRYDADGSGAGAAVKIAALSAGLSLTAGHFWIV